MVTTEYIERLQKVARGHRLTIPEYGSSDIETYVEIIRGKLNAEVYGTALDWMLPKWVLELRRKNQLSSDVSLSNSTSCSWTRIGGVGGFHTGISDDTGLLMANPECASLDFWILDDDTLLFPTIESFNGTRLILESAEDQIYSWSHQVGPVEFVRHIYHVQDGNREAIYNEIVITNKSLSDSRLTFFAVVRPMSIRGVEPIVNIEYVEDSYRVIVNGYVAVELDRSPTSLVMTTADNPNLVNDALSMIERRDTSYHTVRGLATAILRFDIILRPARTTTLYFVQPFDLSQDSAVTPFPKSGDMREKTIEKWYDFMDSTVSAVFPEPAFNDYFTMAKAFVAMNARYSLSPESDLTPIEKTRLLVAICQIGNITFAERIALDVVHQISECIQDECFVDALVLSWGLLYIFEISRNKTYFSRVMYVIDEVEAVVREKIIAAISTKERSPTDRPIIDNTTFINQSVTESNSEYLSLFSDDSTIPIDETSMILGDSDVFDPSEFVSLRLTLFVGRLLVDALDRYGHRMRAEDLHALCEDYYNYLTKSGMTVNFQSFENENERILWIYKLFNFAILFGDSPREYEIIAECSLAIRSQLMRRGLLRTIDREDVLSPFLTLRLAQTYALRNDSDSIEALLQRVLKTASADKVIADELSIGPSPQVRVGSTIRSAVELVLLFRRMIVADVDENLIILGGIPEEWFDSERDLIFSKVPTRMGEIEVSMGSSANQHQIDVLLDDLPQVLEIHVPGFRGIKVFKVYGGSVIGRIDDPVSPHLQIIPLADNVVVTYHK